MAFRGMYDHCTLDDLLNFERELTGECHRCIPMDAGYAVMIRTGENAYIAEKQLSFEKTIIDNAIVCVNIPSLCAKR